MSFKDLYCDVDSEYTYDKNHFAHGANSVVYKGFHKQDTRKQNPVAIKKLSGYEISEKYIDKKRFWREIELLKSIDHPYCLQILNFSINPPIIVTPLMNEGTLDDFLKKQDNDFNATQKMCTIYSLCLTMHAIHLIKVIHRDLKPANIFLRKRGEIYDILIADFGSARKVDKNVDITINPHITPKYAAPETFNETLYSNSIDVYAFGVIYYQYFKYEIVFEKGAKPTTFFAFANLIIKGERFIRPPEMNDDQWITYLECTDNNDLARPKFDQLADRFEKNESLWLKGVDKKVYLDYVKECKTIYQNFMKKHPDIIQFDEHDPLAVSQSLILSRSARNRRSQSRLQLSNRLTTSYSMPTSLQMPKSTHIDYLSPDQK